MFAFRIGLTLGLGLIGAIGAQNVFVIKQGVKNEYVFMCVLICILCDIFLISISVLGVNQLIEEFPIFRQLLTWLGIGFLLCYGSLSIYRGFKSQKIQPSLSQLNNPYSTTMGKIILLALSFSLLNPHAILDTVVLIGGFATQYEGWEQYEFMLGTMAASVIWFCLLVLLSRFASKYLMSPRGWQVLEFTSGFIMIALAVKLYL
jgi:L-lysine exporter family protein LysE/ArgO